MKRLAWAFAATLTGVCGSAFANGRYPIANQLVVSPGDDARLVLRTTFGLVLSQDHGKTFQWVCEKAAGFVNGEDPPVEVTEDSSLFVASSQALNISHDGGCGWQTALEDLSIVDADVDQSQPKRAVAIASLYEDGGTVSGLQETLDNGNTWHALGTSFDGLPATVALAPSQPTRIYASGTSVTDLTPLLSTSEDNGATWHRYPLTLEKITVPFLAAVDPQHPEVVYVRAPTAAGTDVLVVSADFGQHFKAIYKAKGGLYGFALSPDGTHVAVGGPNDPLTIASTADYLFQPANAVLPLCLKWSAAGLYACADEAKSDFSLGLSVDSGATFKTLFRKPALTLLSCAATTQTGQYCPQAWVGQQATLGIDAGAPSAGAPSNDAGVVANAGGGAANEGGSSGALSGSGGASAVGAKPASKSSSCALSVSPGPERQRAFFWVWIAVGLCSLRLRRSRRLVDQP